MRRRLALAVLAVLASASAGCGDDTPPDPTGDLTPAQILERAQTATGDLRAYRLAATVNLDLDAVPGTLPGLLEDSLSEPVQLSGEGPVDGANASFDLDVVVAGLPPIQANVTKVGRGLYVGLLGTDYRVDAPQERIGAAVPTRLAGQLLGWVGQPEVVGREDVDGVRTVRLRGRVDAATAIPDLASAVASVTGRAPPTAAVRQSVVQADVALPERTVDVWLGTEDLRPRRIAATIRLIRPLAALPQLRRGVVGIDVRLSALGVATELVAPPTTEVLDLDRLRAFSGG